MILLTNCYKFIYLFICFNINFVKFSYYSVLVAQIIFDCNILLLKGVITQKIPLFGILKSSFQAIISMVMTKCFSQICSFEFGCNESNNGKKKEIVYLRKNFHLFFNNLFTHIPYFYALGGLDLGILFIESFDKCK